ncbi:RNA 2'-phosphotransferase [Candidatus Bathyarchaeota archaeon]|nr:RNA 2'-phosphotransferase [Candidatus Bathyarchaeota archaeon]
MSSRMEQDLKVRVSRYMSYLLRHNPEGLKMDRRGFVGLDRLLEKLDDRFQIDESFVLEIVEKSDRRRFEVVGGRIRALYGHTIPVRLELEEDELAKVFYHGTTTEAASEILRVGLRPMKRRWVHLSPTMEIAREVGYRRTESPVVLEVDAEAARGDGLKFYRATEKVYVCGAVLPRFIKVAGR